MNAGNTAQQSINDTNSSVPFPATGITGQMAGMTTGSGLGKEREIPKQVKIETIQELSKDVELTKEVAEAGVSEIKGVIDLPPDIKKLGVTQTGAMTPAVSTTALPQVVLPISDPQIIVGLHAKIVSSFRWLAAWCVRKLKKAHIALKVVHGKIIRVRIK